MRILLLTLLTCTMAATHAGLLPIHTENGKLKDTCNRQVILHGVNIMNKRPPHTLQAMGFSNKHMELLESKGFNLVRLGVFWAAIEPRPGQYNSAYLESIRKTVEALAKYNIYTIIDFHQDAYSSKDNFGMGFPEWAALGEGSSYNPGFPLIYQSGKKIGNQIVGTKLADSFDKFWQNKKIPGSKRTLQQAYMDMLSFSVSKLKDLSSIAGFEIMNEPFIGKGWQKCVINKQNPQGGCRDFEKKTLYAFTKKAIKTIHQVSPQSIVWYEPEVSFSVGAKTHLPKLNEPNIGFSFHNYAKAHQLAFTYAKQQRALQQAPLLMSEFGAATANSNKLEKILKLADANQVSWAYWSYANNPSFPFASQTDLPTDPRKQGIVIDLNAPLKKPNLKTHLLSILSTNYPAAVKGRLIETHWKNSNYKITYKPLEKKHCKNTHTVIMLNDSKATLSYKNAALIKRLSNQVILKAKSLKQRVRVTIINS